MSAPICSAYAWAYGACPFLNGVIYIVGIMGFLVTMSAALSMAVWLRPRALAVLALSFTLVSLLLLSTKLILFMYSVIATQNVFTLFPFAFYTIQCSIITCKAHLMKIKHDILVTGSVAILSLISGNCTQLSHILLYDDSDNAAPA